MFFFNSFFGDTLSQLTKCIEVYSIFPIKNAQKGIVPSVCALCAHENMFNVHNMLQFNL